MGDHAGIVWTLLFAYGKSSMDFATCVKLRIARRKCLYCTTCAHRVTLVPSQEKKNTEPCRFPFHIAPRVAAALPSQLPDRRTRLSLVKSTIATGEIVEKDLQSGLRASVTAKLNVTPRENE